MATDRMNDRRSFTYPYPLPLPAAADIESRTISFPLADAIFDPPLFQPTERLPNLNRSGMRHLKNAFQALYATMEDMGYLVNRCPPQDAAIVFDWSEKQDTQYGDRPRLFMEHGWLPRSSYQLSTHGTNARSHVAKRFLLSEPDARQAQYVMRQSTIMRRIFEDGQSAVHAEQVRQRLPESFIFFPLQLATDYNLRFSNSPLAEYYSADSRANVTLAQACVDMVEAARLPLPGVFKQHPGDPWPLREHLRFSDHRNTLIDNTEAITAVDVIASGACQLVISINSNTLHEALVFSRPVIALGTLLWQERPDSRPFAHQLQEAERMIGHDPLNEAGTIGYLYHLFANQWYLGDFQNPLMVKALIDHRGDCVPLDLRLRFGLGTAGAPN